MWDWNCERKNPLQMSTINKPNDNEHCISLVTSILIYNRKHIKVAQNSKWFFFVLFSCPRFPKSNRLFLLKIFGLCLLLLLLPVADWVCFVQETPSWTLLDVHEHNDKLTWNYANFECRFSCTRKSWCICLNIAFTCFWKIGVHSAHYTITSHFENCTLISLHTFQVERNRM